MAVSDFLTLYTCGGLHSWKTSYLLCNIYFFSLILYINLGHGSLIRCHLGLGGVGNLLHLLEEAGVHLEAGARQFEAQLLAGLFGDHAVMRDRPGKIGNFSPEAVLI